MSEATPRHFEVHFPPALFVSVVVLGLIAGLRPSVASPTITASVWAGLLAMMVVGVVWPLADRRALGLEILSCPTDVTEGEQITVEFGLGRAGFPLRVDLDPSVGRLQPDGAAFINARQGEVSALLARRGVYSELGVWVTDSGPFDLLRVRRMLRCRLPAPLFVGPAPVDINQQIEPVGTADARSVPTHVAPSGDTVRSVRPYVTGDPAHLVHWPSSAHAGSLMVKELEPQGDRLVAVVLDLRAGGDRGEAEPDVVEHAVRRVAGTAREALEHGMRVILCTADPSGAVTAEVGGLLALQRRLAAAVPGVPGTAPDGCRPVVFTPIEASPR